MKILKNMKQSTFLLLLVGVLLVASVFSGYMHHRAAEMGASVGKVNGTVVGTAIGSAKGITKGTQEGRAAGEQAGLSAEDTIVDIKGSMEEMGRLEVLTAEVTLKNINKIGKAYTGLFLIIGDATFTVDMAEAQVSRSQDGGKVSVVIPKPELSLYPNMENTKKLAEYQKFSLTVSAQDGLIAYLNSMTKTVEEVKDTMSNYDSLYAEAIEAADTQIQQLVKRICGKEISVQVQFK